MVFMWVSPGALARHKFDVLSQSITRTAVSGHESKLFSSGKAAFRFLVPRSVVEMDPVTAPLIETPNDNELLNFVCIHPEAESQGSKEGMIPPAMS